MLVGLIVEKIVYKTSISQ